MASLTLIVGAGGATVLAGGSTPAFAATPARASTPTPASPANAVPPPTTGTYLGVVPNTARGAVDQLGSFDASVGRNVAISSYFMSWSAPVPMVALETALSHGAIPMLSWLCGPTDAAVASGTADATIVQAAQQLKALGRPVLLRWFWEMNLGVGARCMSTQGAAGYVAAFDHIWNVFHAVGATNVSFVWAPSAAPSAGPAAPYYPGSQYVDWIGSDLYDRLEAPSCTTPTGSFAQLYQAFYNTFSTYGKPLALTETGAGCQANVPTTFPAAQASWLAQISLAVAGSGSTAAVFPGVRAVVYVNSADSFGNYTLTGAGLAQYKAMLGLAAFAPVDSTLGGPSDGYWLAAADGGVGNYGAPWYGSPKATVGGGAISSPVVAIAPTADDRGYFVLFAGGGVANFGDASWKGSLANQLPRGVTATALAVDPATGGYWVATSNGGVAAFAAPWYGSPRVTVGGGPISSPSIAISPTADGMGYFVLFAGGGLANFGNARWMGSLAHVLAAGAKATDVVVDPATGGYWILASDGSLANYDSPWYGSPKYSGGQRALATGLAVDPLTGGYRIMTDLGGVYSYQAAGYGSGVVGSDGARFVGVAGAG